MTEPLILKVRTTASAPQVHSALTEEKSLTTWLAEYATVDLPERYEFWGPSVPEGDAPHQQLVTADATSLAFTWLLDGEETSTEIAIAVENDETIITLTQSHFDFNDVITGASIRGVLQTFWALALANLVDSLEGRTITARGDFTSSNLSATVEIDAAVDAVYDSLISTEKVSEWFGYPIEIEPHVDGRFALGGIENNPHPAIIVDLVPNERVSVDWGPAGSARGNWKAPRAGPDSPSSPAGSIPTIRPTRAGWATWPDSPSSAAITRSPTGCPSPSLHDRPPDWHGPARACSASEYVKGAARHPNEAEQIRTISETFGRGNP